MPQIRPLADTVHYKYILTYLLTYLNIDQFSIFFSPAHSVVTGVKIWTSYIPSINPTLLMIAELSAEC